MVGTVDSREDIGQRIRQELDSRLRKQAGVKFAGSVERLNTGFINHFGDGVGSCAKPSNMN